MIPGILNMKYSRIVLSLLFTLMLAGLFSLSLPNTVYAVSDAASVEDRIRSVDMGGLTADNFKVEPKAVGFPPFSRLQRRRDYKNQVHLPSLLN